MPKLAKPKNATTPGSAKNSTNSTPAAKKLPQAKTITTREVLYPEIKVQKCIGKEAITASQCKDLLGWSNNPLQSMPDEPHLFTDMNNQKVWCHNAVNPDYRNRNFALPHALGLKQEILRENWEFNGETIIIGQTGCTLDGNHSMVALVLAVQEWEKNKDKWSNWKEEPVLEKIIVYGINESDKVVNTIGTGRPRSLEDAIFRSDIFASLKFGERKICAKIASHAIKLLHHRLGVSQNAFAPKQTHAEALDFLAKHPLLLKCVKHIFAENSDKAIQPVITPGYAAAMMYLMALSKTDPKVYHGSDSKQEALCNTDNFELAEEFFVNISGQMKTFTPLFDASKHIEHQSRECKLALVAKAWMLFAAGTKLTKEGLALSLNEEYKLLECPTVGGIDLGNPKEEHAADEPSEAEKNGHKEAETKIKAEKLNGKASKNGQAATEKRGFGTKPAKGKKAKPQVGDRVYVSEDGGYYEGELIEIYDAMGKPVGKVKDLNKKTWDTPMENVTLEEPDV